jgi:O-antigen ligase
MNSTAIRTDARLAAGAPVSAESVRTLLAFLLLAIAWISFSPFQGTGAEIEEGGKVVNQIGYPALTAAAILAIATTVHRNVLIHLVSPGWVLMYALVLFSAVTAPDTENTMRSVLFALFATTMAASILVLPPSADALSRVLAAACLLVLGLSYAGLALMPDVAIHQAAGREAFHAGLWRGIFTHKNIAGPVMASITFAGIYLMRRQWRWTGAAIAILALIFIWNTGSKTSAALVPAIVLLVAGPAITGMRGLAGVLVLLSILAIHAMTIGTVFVPLFDAILRAFDETTTYTGRLEIWEFARDFLLVHPWTGYGFDSFWNTPVTQAAEQPFDRTWDPRGIIHGHNGFLDITLFMGFPALMLSVWLFVVAPVWHYLRTPRLRENVLLADFCLMIVAFVTMNAALESFFFRRADPVWLTLVIALAGLSFCSRMRVRAN